jgi:hypothetical protein
MADALLEGFEPRHQPLKLIDRTAIAHCGQST